MTGWQPPEHLPAPPPQRGLSEATRAWPAARFRSKFEVADGGCWAWLRPKMNGYGYFYMDGREQLAHRVSYEFFVGPIPDGLVIDHLCRNTTCVNPDHLEPVTQSENVRRGESAQQMRERHAARTACLRGHEFTAENTYNHPRGYRSCRACQRIRERARRASRV